MGEEIHLAIKIVMYRVLKNRLISSRVSLLDNARPLPKCSKEKFRNEYEKWIEQRFLRSFSSLNSKFFSIFEVFHIWKRIIENPYIIFNTSSKNYISGHLKNPKIDFWGYNDPSLKYLPLLFPRIFIHTNSYILPEAEAPPYAHWSNFRKKYNLRPKH